MLVINDKGKPLLNSRLFVDDIATTTETVPQTKDLLNKLSEKLNWAGLSVKANKCRSLIIIKGEPQKREIKINGNTITPIQNMPVKYLGKMYTASLDEKEQIQRFIKILEDEARKIDKCKLPGRYKSWILQHMLIPKLMWPLKIYNIPLTTVEKLQNI